MSRETLLYFIIEEKVSDLQVMYLLKFMCKEVSQIEFCVPCTLIVDPESLRAPFKTGTLCIEFHVKTKELNRVWDNLTIKVMTLRLQISSVKPSSFKIIFILF